MSTIETPNFEGNVSVGALSVQTEHALAAVILAALAMLWAIRFSFPKP